MKKFDEIERRLRGQEEKASMIDVKELKFKGAITEAQKEQLKNLISKLKLEKTKDLDIEDSKWYLGQVR